MVFEQDCGLLVVYALAAVARRGTRAWTLLGAPLGGRQGSADLAVEQEVHVLSDLHRRAGGGAVAGGGSAIDLPRSAPGRAERPLGVAMPASCALALASFVGPSRLG